MNNIGKGSCYRKSCLHYGLMFGAHCKLWNSSDTDDSKKFGACSRFIDGVKNKRNLIISRFLKEIQ